MSHIHISSSLGSDYVRRKWQTIIESLTLMYHKSRLRLQRFCVKLKPRLFASEKSPSRRDICQNGRRIIKTSDWLDVSTLNESLRDDSKVDERNSNEGFDVFERLQDST